MKQVARSYALGLYSLAVQEGLCRQIGQQLELVQAVFRENPDFLALLAAETIKKQERCQILERCFHGAVHPYVLHLLKIFTEKRYIRYLDGCCKAFHDRYCKNNGILQVKAVSAVLLTKKQLSHLRKKLERHTGKKILLTNTADPGCIGGILLHYDGKQIDGTVAGYLQAIGAMLHDPSCLDGGGVTWN